MKQEKEDLITKWLNNELTPEELEAFKQLDEYPAYAKISEKAKHFKAPNYDEKTAFEQLEFATHSDKTSSKLSGFKYVAAIAAIAIIAFTLFKTLTKTPSLKSFETSTAKTEVIELPDNSKVNLNANSSLTYKSSEWDSNRELQLDGEALFEVEKGQTFTVNTSYAKVEVLGTIFNVKSRDYAFEVTCYEGSVKVTVDGNSYILKPSDNLVLNQNNISISQNKSAIPDWKSNQTLINSQPFDTVLKEFKNYYDVNFDTSNIDVTRIYTGSFSHKDLKIALNSITLPLGLTYTIDGNTIILSNK
ncbi:FecR family protein [Flavobacteriaceae bacterium 14752]|uniref:FecR family protein n=1 Tax=Mesohalobacter salilacus TaxID=2491711 RepID=UPI000F633541|nr:FecR family protein [Flavobacteriaceae bacterium 14752]